jgi:ubiquinone/menaquinone biosynthesis C-methylase UbiE
MHYAYSESNYDGEEREQILMNKWFPKWYDALMSPMEKRGFQTIRENLIAKAEGRVLEIGSGTGVNFPYYQHADEVIAIEPQTLMLEQSLVRAGKSLIPIKVVCVSGEELPFADDSFDTVVGTLVLCSIPDPSKALDEVRRVCKPGGKVLWFEHVRVNSSILGSLQDWLTPAWKRLCDGCHLNRDTLTLVKQAGFKIINTERFYKSIFLVVESINRK